MGSLGALGSTIKLNPPAPTEVIVENFPDWSWKMKKYLGLQDPLLPAFLTELEVQNTPVNDQQIVTFGSLDGTDPTEEDRKLSVDFLLGNLMCSCRILYWDRRLHF